MDPQALDDIHGFTASVDHPDLFSYLGIENDADRNTVLHALQVRRSWAQGQQANPKFRQEALWLIKNIERVKEALTSNRSDYIIDLQRRDERKNLDTLSIFIKGTLADGNLTVRGEEAIQQQGEALGLPESVVIRRIGEILAERDAGTLGAPTETSVEDSFELPAPDDLYGVLDVDPSAPQEDLEEAYRRRYRWARQLRDTDKSSRMYSLLDEAWRVLQDPDRRAEFDESRTAKESTAPEPPGQDNIGLLPPPPITQSLALPVPSVEQHLAAVLNDENPVISMPTARPERDAPPPPQIPPPGDDDTDYSLEVLDDVTVEDLPRPEPQLIEEAMFGGQLDPNLTLAAPAPDVDTLDPDPESDAEAADDPPYPIPDGPDIPLFGSFNLDDLDMNLSGESPSEPNLPDSDGLNLSGDLSGLDMGLMKVAPSEPLDGLDTGEPPAVLSAGQVFNDMAELRIDGPKVIRIRTGAHPFPVRFTVANAGEGPMPATVTSDAGWVQISPSVLDPNRRTQVVEALVEPDGMPGNAAKAVLTIDAEHGEVETIVIDAIKYVVSPLTLFVSAILAVIVCLVVVAGSFLGVLGSEVGKTNDTILGVRVRPPAGEVYINDELVGNQGPLSLVNSVPVDEPFQLRVELDGFEPFIREVELSSGDDETIEVDLVLRDAVDFEPTPGMVEASIDADAIDAAIEARQEPFDNCFTRNLRTNTPFTAEIEITCTVTDRGFIHGVKFGAANFRSPAVQNCLKRQLRALKLPLIPGDYARFERLLSVEIRPLTALNDGINP